MAFGVICHFSITRTHDKFNFEKPKLFGCGNKVLHFSRFFRNFALLARSYLHSEEKTNTFVLFFSRFFVTL